MNELENKKKRKTRTVKKEVEIDRTHLVECSVVINNSLRMYLIEKLKEFARGKSELGTFSGLIIYLLMQHRTPKMDIDILNFYYTEAIHFQEKYNISDRHAIKESDIKASHVGTVRFQIMDLFNEKLAAYAEELTKLSFKQNHPINKISKSTLLFCMLCYARNNNIPKQRHVDYIPVVKDTGLNESLVKDVMWKIE